MYLQNHSIKYLEVSNGVVDIWPNRNLYWGLFPSPLFLVSMKMVFRVHGDDLEDSLKTKHLSLSLRVRSPRPSRFSGKSSPITVSGKHCIRAGHVEYMLLVQHFRAYRTVFLRRTQPIEARLPSVSAACNCVGNVQITQ